MRRWVILLASALAVVACQPERPTAHVADQPASQVEPATERLPQHARKQERTIDVFFAHMQKTADDFTAVLPLKRTTEREDIATFALEQLIIGPTAQEREQGYYTELNLQESPPSSCGGNDFRIKIEDGLALLQLCRFPEQFHTTGGDARVISQVERTIKQFQTIDRVIMLDPELRCYGDRSGYD
jgi:hypothetical protein